MAYADISIASVPDERRDAYRAFCDKAGSYILSLGALEVVDYWGDDIPGGEVTSLPMAVKAAPGETVVASRILWPDKATRDAGWEKMMSGGGEGMGDMPFDGRRMIFGGFTELVTVSA